MATTADNDALLAHLAGGQLVRDVAHGGRTGEDPFQSLGEDDRSGSEERLSGSDRYAALLASDISRPNDLDDLVGPTFWPGLPLSDVVSEWAELRDWVEELIQRYPHLDHHVIPACWYRHNGHVEALAALRDHERVSFADSSPATSPAQWHWAFAQIEGRLREWTAQAGCMSLHRDPVAQLRPVDDDAWDVWVAADREQRVARYLSHLPRETPAEHQSVHR
jgi:hypothetical protein